MTSDKISDYSRQTKNLLENFMKTAKLTTKQRKFIRNHIVLGKAISTLPKSPIYRPRCISAHHVSKRAKKRTKNTIINCGAYDVEKFIPTKSATDRKKEIEKLQNICSGIDRIEDEEQLPSNKGTFSINDRIGELMKEIEERIEFLQIMEDLGCKRKYEFDISLEISDKLHHLEKLSKEKNLKFDLQRNQ